MRRKIKYTFALVLICAASTMFCLMANLISGRVGYFGPWIAPMGVFFFPFIYILSDITSDVYGYRISRYIAWWTNLCNILFVGGILLVVTINKPAPWSIDSDKAIKLLLIGGNGTSGMIRVMIAGIIGAVLGGWVNDIIFQVYRHRDGVEHFAKRKLLSSLGAEIVDTAVFITLAFSFTPAWSVAMYIVQFVMKYSVEIITEPLAHKLACYIRSIEGEEVFEDRNNFNLFGMYRKDEK